MNSLASQTEESKAVECLVCKERNTLEQGKLEQNLEKNEHQLQVKLDQEKEEERAMIDSSRMQIRQPLE